MYCKTKGCSNPEGVPGLGLCWQCYDEAFGCDNVIPHAPWYPEEEKWEEGEEEIAPCDRVQESH